MSLDSIVNANFLLLLQFFYRAMFEVTFGEIKGICFTGLTNAQTEAELKFLNHRTFKLELCVECSFIVQRVCVFLPGESRS